MTLIEGLVNSLLRKNRMGVCLWCRGSGNQPVRPNSKPEKYGHVCRLCNGTGEGDE